MNATLRPRALRECDDNSLFRIYDAARARLQDTLTASEREQVEKNLLRASDELRRRGLKLTATLAAHR